VSVKRTAPAGRTGAATFEVYSRLVGDSSGTKESGLLEMKTVPSSCSNGLCTKVNRSKCSRALLVNLTELLL
jgi:hypothetical protein